MGICFLPQIPIIFRNVFRNYNAFNCYKTSNKETMEEILDDFEQEEGFVRQYEYADRGKRFANYLIDIVGYYLFSIMIGLVLGVLSVAFGSEEIFLEEQPGPGAELLEILFGIVLITTYYTVLEYVFKGKTLGKLITRTRAVTEDGERMDLQTTFIRSLCRLVPFEPFSFLGEPQNGWHDKWSKTKVILDRDWRDTSK